MPTPLINLLPSASGVINITRAALNTLRTNSTLIPNVTYAVRDEGIMAFATATNSYTDYPGESAITRAALNTARDASLLVPNHRYLVRDAGVTAVATAVNAYTDVPVPGSIKSIQRGTISMLAGNSPSTLLTSVQSGGHGICISPDGSRLYCSDPGNSRVVVVNTVTMAVVTNINVGNGPGPIVINSAGTRVYVLNRTANTVSVIDTSNNTVTATISSGYDSGTRGIAINNSTNRLFVTSTWASRLHVHNTTNNSHVGNFNLGASNPTSICINPAQTRLYVPCIDSSGSGIPKCVVLDATTFSVVANPNINTPLDDQLGCVCSADGSRVFIALDQNPSSQVITTSNNVAGSVSLGAAQRSYAPHPTLPRMIFTFHTNNGFGGVDWSSGSLSHYLTNNTGFTGPSTGIVVHPDGAQAFMNEGNHVRRITLEQTAIPLTISAVDPTKSELSNLGITYGGATDLNQGGASIALELTSGTVITARRSAQITPAVVYFQLVERN